MKILLGLIICLIFQGIFLESSNVKSVDQLVAGIEQSRAFEINVKFITTAKELDEAGASLMRVPN